MKYAIIVRGDDKSNLIAEEIKARINCVYDEDEPDAVVAIGGDGTILKAVHAYPNSIIFGVCTGHLGFYANYSPDKLDVLIDDINNNNYRTETSELLSCEIKDSTGRVIKDNAINEITIVTPPRTLILDVSIDDTFLERFRGTGFCISTPSGSTAYNKSLHGSVVDCRLNIMQLTEIAGINSNSYRTLSSPMILERSRVLRFDSVKGNDEVFITVDHISYNIKNFMSLTVKYSGKNIKRAFHDHEGFLKRINRTFLMSKD